MEVPVTEYRRRLAHYHALAREGEPIYVTEHGVPTVRVSTATDDEVVARLVARGDVRPPVTRSRRPLPPPVPYDGPPSEVQIAEERR
ncbi:MAG: type II toxin-antitoxin system prevent-host-death family antitoxin [Nitriliruptor sp.]